MSVNGRKIGRSWDSEPAATETEEAHDTAPWERAASEPEQTEAEKVKLFDVVCTIGSVYAGGEHSPMEAAFLLIARHGGDETYAFPTEDGGLVQVQVRTTLPKPPGV